MKNIRILFLIITIFTLFTSPLSLALCAGSGAAFLKIDHSARSYALGQNGAVGAYGAEAMGLNPANLMELPRKMEVLTAYSSQMDGVSHAHLAGAINRSMNKNMMVDAFGFSYTRLAVDGMEGRDGNGQKTEDFGSDSSQMSMSLSGNAGHVRLGMTGKIVQSRIGSWKANTALAMDLGASYGFNGFGKKMTAGISVNNLGQGMRFIGEMNDLPAAVNLGLAANMGLLNLSGGLRQEMQGETKMNLGVEFNLGALSLRAGMNSLSGGSRSKDAGTMGIFEGLSSGIGLNLKMARLDYAIGQGSADLGLSQRMTLTLQFGKQAN